jgi:predicted secreted protein
MTSDSTDDNQLTGRVGEPVQIRLASTPGTGAIWYAPPSPPHTTIESMASKPLGSGVGGSVQQVFVFRADAPGTYPLEFRLKREWEKEVRKEQKVVIRILS